MTCNVSSHIVTVICKVICQAIFLEKLISCVVRRPEPGLAGIWPASWPIATAYPASATAALPTPRPHSTPTTQLIILWAPWPDLPATMDTHSLAQTPRRASQIRLGVEIFHIARVSLVVMKKIWKFPFLASCKWRGKLQSAAYWRTTLNLNYSREHCN